MLNEIKHNNKIELKTNKECFEIEYTEYYDCLLNNYFIKSLLCPFEMDCYVGSQTCILDCENFISINKNEKKVTCKRVSLNEVENE